jgi:hypothetical protein
MKMQAIYIQPSWDKEGLSAGLRKGEYYDVEFAIVRRSSTSICLKGVDGLFNSALFRYELNGNEVNIVEDARPLLKRTAWGSYMTTLIRYRDSSDDRLINIRNYVSEEAIVYRNLPSEPKG